MHAEFDSQVVHSTQLSVELCDSPSMAHPLCFVTLRSYILEAHNEHDSRGGVITSSSFGFLYSNYPLNPFFFNHKKLSYLKHTVEYW